jgi:hypothetical protein
VLWKTCGRLVNILWTTRHENFFSTIAFRISRDGGLWMRFRGSLRLFRGAACVEFPRLVNASFAPTVTNVVHRFEESIAGRAYLIEVSPVAKDRWRAYIVRVPNVPTALMPFYGTTPLEAARHLSDWLTRAHERAGNPAATV